MKKKQLLLPVLSGLLLSPLVLSQQVLADEPAADEVEAVILHTNDVHGRILEERGVIGDAKAAALIAEERAKVATTLVVDAGDAFQGLPISNSTQGEDRARIMNEIGYDAMAVGNHEFDFGLEQAKKYKEILNFPLLSANTYVNDARLFESHTIVDKDRTREGDEFVVIGVTTPETSTKTHPKNVEGVVFADPVTEVNKVVDEVEARAKAENRTYKNYIVLAHLGVDATTPVAWQGSTLAKALSENSKLAGKRVVVIDGHSHTVESATYGDNVTYSQTGSYHNNLGVVTLKSGKLLAETRLIKAADAKTTTPDAKIAALVADIKAKYEKENAIVVLDKNPVDLEGDRSHVRVRETNLGNVIADALYQYGQNGGFSHKTSLAVTNGGGIRATLAKDKPVTKGDIIAVLPFGNIVSQITVTGQQIAEMFDKSLSAAIQVNKETGLPVLDERGLPLLDANGGFLHISGAKLAYDPTKPQAERVLSIEILDATSNTYLPLDKEATYYLATNDFLAAGGDGYTMLGGAREEGPSMDSVFADYLKVADLSRYAVVNPNTRLEAITEADYAKRVAERLNDLKGEHPRTQKGDSLVETGAPAYPGHTRKGESTQTPDQPVYPLASHRRVGLISSGNSLAPRQEKDERGVATLNQPAAQLPLAAATDKKAAEATQPAPSSSVLPKTGQTSGMSLSLLGLSLVGLGLAARRKRA